MSDEIRPFAIAVDDDVLLDLRHRLRATRWPDPEVVGDWSQGVRTAYVKEVCRYWADAYDWRSREAELNRFDHVITEIDDVDIHLIHQRSPHPDALPLVLTHGWPGSVVEFAKVIGPLTDPPRYGGDAADAFHVVAPSLPGFAFSGKPTVPGWGVEKIAEVWATLLARLGYDRYVAQGGDWGSAVTSALGARDPVHCAAIHITLAMSVKIPDRASTPEEQHAIDRRDHYDRYDSGYARIQMTRPQTLGFGLADSPAGQAAWILEKFWAWTDCDGHPENAIERDALLDNIMLYWVTNSATSSARIYWESFGGRRVRPVVEVPTGMAVYPKEIVPPVRAWVDELWPNVQYWSEHDRGGHFAAFEVPATFVDDLRTFFRRFR